MGWLALRLEDQVDNFCQCYGHNIFFCSLPPTLCSIIHCPPSWSLISYEQLYSCLIGRTRHRHEDKGTPCVTILSLYKLGFLWYCYFYQILHIPSNLIRYIFFLARIWSLFFILKKILHATYKYLNIECFIFTKDLQGLSPSINVNMLLMLKSLESLVS